MDLDGIEPRGISDPGPSLQLGLVTMSVSSSSSPLNRFRDALPSVVKKSRHSEIWGFSLEQAESRVLELVLEKVLGLRAHVVTCD